MTGVVHTSGGRKRAGTLLRKFAQKRSPSQHYFKNMGHHTISKCDIEGADDIFVRQLAREHRRPAFVSVEAISLEILAILYAGGYDRIQIVNQAFNGYVKPPKPAREGEFVTVQFNGHMSGLFGRELAPDKWIGFGEAARRYLDFVALQARSDTLAHGWLDFYVTSAENLKQPT